MKKKRMLLVVALCVAGMMTGCGSKNNATTENTESGNTIVSETDDVTTGDSEEVVAENKTESEQEAESEQDTETESEETSETAGVTGVISGVLEASGKDKIGETDAYGIVDPIIYDVTLENNTLTISGATNYRNYVEQDPISISDDETVSYTVTEDTVYVIYSGEADPEYMTQDEFAEYLTQVMDSGLSFEISVTDGVVTEASISS